MKLANSVKSTGNYGSVIPCDEDLGRLMKIWVGSVPQQNVPQQNVPQQNVPNVPQENVPQQHVPRQNVPNVPQQMAHCQGAKWPAPGPMRKPKKSCRGRPGITFLARDPLHAPALPDANETKISNFRRGSASGQRF